MKFSYKDSGVNIDAADEAKRTMANELDNADNSGRVMNRVGAFASLYDFKDMGVENPVLVLKTEEPGTKQMLSFAYKKIKNICYDMINHLTNDIIVMGATPLTVQDAIVCGKLEVDVVPQIVKYIAEACRDNGSVLTGGETSEQPGMLRQGTYVLTSSIVGIADKNQIVDGSNIEIGDTVMALASNGIHTNGYSFLRKMMEIDAETVNADINGEKFIDVILKPHRAYYKPIIQLKGNNNLVGMAHITGGGIAGNLNRVLPFDLNAVIDLSLIKVLPIFKYIKRKTATDDAELLKTFNMGVGMTLVIKKEWAEECMTHFASHGIECYPIGKIIKGEKKVIYTSSLNY